MIKDTLEDLVLDVLAKHKGVWATQPIHEELTASVSYVDFKVNPTWTLDMVSEIMDRMAKRRWYLSHSYHDSILRIVYKSIL